MAPEKPRLRKAKPITQEEALHALGSTDLQEIRDALLDGARCLDTAWFFPRAWRFVEHENQAVRSAAVFAVDHCRSALIEELVAGVSPEAEDSRVLVLGRLASSDPDAAVRNMAGTVLTGVISELAARLRR